jgi:hypothetical protein
MDKDAHCVKEAARAKEGKPRPSLIARIRAAASDFVQRHERRVRPIAEAARANGWMIFAFGGVPRGLADRGARYVPRDVDIVLADDSFGPFAETFKSEITRRTRFGGIHLVLNGLEIDAWPLSSTWAFREGLVSEKSFGTLPETTFLNCDGIVVQFATRQGQAREVYATGLEETSRRGALDIKLEPNPYPTLCVVRSLRMAEQRELPFTPKLAYYCWNELSKRSHGEFVQIQESHYGTVYYSEEKLKRIVDRLDRHLEKDPLFDFHLVRQHQLWERVSDSGAD